MTTATREPKVSSRTPIHELILDRCEQLLCEIGTTIDGGRSRSRKGPRIDLLDQSKTLNDYLSLLHDGYIPVKERARIKPRLAGILDRLTGFLELDGSSERYLGRSVTIIREML